MRNGNRPTPEAWREAARLALTSVQPRREIAENPGIGLPTLTRWLSQERDVTGPIGAPGTGVRATEPQLSPENILAALDAAGAD